MVDCHWLMNVSISSDKLISKQWIANETNCSVGSIQSLMCRWWSRHYLLLDWISWIRANETLLRFIACYLITIFYWIHAILSWILSWIHIDLIITSHKELAVYIYIYIYIFDFSRLRAPEMCARLEQLLISIEDHCNCW